MEGRKMNDKDRAERHEMEKDSELTYEEAKKPIHGVVGEDEESNNSDISNNNDKLIRNTDDNETFVSTISITDEQGKEYKFVKPEFECELLKEVRDYFIGYFFNADSEVAEAVCWRKDGKAFTTFGIVGSMDKRISDYNLTPIKEAWYDNVKPFTLVIHTVDNKTMYIVDYIEDGNAYDKDDTLIDVVDKLRIATPKEHAKLNYQDKE